MKHFIFSLAISIPILIQLVCAYTNFLFPTNLFLSILIGIISMVLIIIGLFRRNTKFIGISSAILVGLIVAFFIQRLQDDLRERNAAQIIRQLRRYKDKNNYYPKTLNSLRPKFLTTIPENYFGFFSRPFIYESSGDDYSLTIETGKITGKKWVNSFATWDYYD
jgi:hypothetical protein